MKYLKKFENFSEQDLGRFTDEEEIKDVISEPEENDQIFDEEEVIEDELKKKVMMKLLGKKKEKKKKVEYGETK